MKKKFRKLLPILCPLFLIYPGNSYAKDSVETINKEQNSCEDTARSLKSMIREKGSNLSDSTSINSKGNLSRSNLDICKIYFEDSNSTIPSQIEQNSDFLNDSLSIGSLNDSENELLRHDFNDTVEIKVRCAGSSHSSPYKVTKKVKNPQENSIDLKLQNYEVSENYLENKDLKYLDLYNQVPFVDVDVDNEGNSHLYWSTNDRLFKHSDFQNTLKKKDLFAKYNDKDGTLRLELYRPGVGADEIFFKKKPSKFSFISVPTGSLDGGQFSISNTARVVSKTLLHYIDSIAPLGAKLNIKLQGHSRGGVGIARALDKLLSALDTVKYEKKLKEKQVKIDCILLDPVAGPDVAEKVLKLTALNPALDVKVTQLFSMDTGRPAWQNWAFLSSAHVPTSVSDSTIVFLPLNHEMGLSSMTTSELDGKTRKTMWKYNDKLLKYGEIGQLEPGVYFPKTKFLLDDSDNKDENAIRLYSPWRDTGKKPIPAIELVRLDNCSDESLDEFQQRLLVDKKWITSSNRKTKFLTLLNRSLHINGILAPNKNLDFDENFKLRISKNENKKNSKKKSFNKKISNKKVSEGNLT